MPQKIVDFAEKLDFTIFLSGDLAYYVIRPEKKSADHFIFFSFLPQRKSYKECWIIHEILPFFIWIHMSLYGPEKSHEKSRKLTL